jgi:hypothetical protein
MRRSWRRRLSGGTVCGETGFAVCVRLDSGLAYPWPALDEADEMTRTTLAEIEGEKL